MNSQPQNETNTWIPFKRYFIKRKISDAEYVSNLIKSRQWFFRYRWWFILLFLLLTLLPFYMLVQINIALPKYFSEPKPGDPPGMIYLHKAQLDYYIVMWFTGCFTITLMTFTLPIPSLIFPVNRDIDLLIKYHKRLQRIYELHPELQESQDEKSITSCQ